MSSQVALLIPIGQGASTDRSQSRSAKVRASRLSSLRHKFSCRPSAGISSPHRPDLEWKDGLVDGDGTAMPGPAKAKIPCVGFIISRVLIPALQLTQPQLAAPFRAPPILACLPVSNSGPSRLNHGLGILSSSAAAPLHAFSGASVGCVGHRAQLLKGGIRQLFPGQPGVDQGMGKGSTALSILQPWFVC